MLRRLIGENIELVTLTSSDLGPVKVDPAQIEQVLINLAVNARDAMPEGGKLTIETSNIVLVENDLSRLPDLAAGEHVKLAVSDTGTGISEDVKARVFEPFFTTKEGKGSGLGLSTCYGIVKQNGGEIEVESELGKGTTFKIYLRRVDEELSSFPKRETADSLPEGEETASWWRTKSWSGEWPPTYFVNRVTLFWKPRTAVRPSASSRGPAMDRSTSC